MTRIALPHGPLITSIDGLALDPADRERLLHPLVGGVILFARNYSDPQQLTRLTGAIRELRSPPLLIAVDHEGGRVQRFREGFTPIPPMRWLGELHDRHPHAATALARDAGFVIASELHACGVDLSFTPVLDLDHGASAVIGDRALHGSAEVVRDLARSLIAGLRQAGMGAVGKHFPGHGWVRADSHTDVPVDPRPYSEIAARDLVPFAALAGELAGIMPAHVVYPSVDPGRAAGFSKRWIGDVLRHRLGFQGLVFSDDLGMEGASGAGDLVGRAQLACAAGCDVVLLCNDPAGTDALLSALRYEMPAVARARLAALQGRSRPGSLVALRESPGYARAVHALGGIGPGASRLL